MAVLQTAVVLAMLGGTPDGMVLVFSSRGCGPCQAMAPGVQRLQQQGYAIRKIDIDREQSVAGRFRIERVPTTVLLVAGRERQRYIGYIGEDQLRRMARSIPVQTEPVGPASPPAHPAQARSSASDGNRAIPPKPRPRNPAQPGSFTPTGPSVPSVIRANIGDTPPPVTSDNPLVVCARIRVRDSRGLDVGSGTIIDSRPGRTIILTCGHIFRHYDSNGSIEVDLFGKEPSRTYDGKLIDHDLQADVGLISIPTLHPLPAAMLSRRPAAAGQHVFSIGCGGGDPPTRLQHLVTSTTRYKAGFVECTGTPNQGRSGGGLFSTDGRVLGVCVLADPKARRGLYAGLPAVQALLDRSGLATIGSIVAQTIGTSAPAANSAVESAALDEPQFELAKDGPFFESDAALASTARSRQLPTTGDLPQPAARTPLDLKPIPTSSADRPALPASFAARNTTELQRKLAAARGAEVICIVRDRNNPTAESRVIIIHKASDRFIADLTGELQTQHQHPPNVQPTSLNIPLPLPKPAPPQTTIRTVRRPASTQSSNATTIQRYRRRR